MVRFITLGARKYDIDEIDGQLSMFGDATKSVMLSVMGDLTQEGIGNAYVDGIRISKPSLVHAVGYKLLIVNIGEVAREYDHTYTVELKDFVLLKRATATAIALFYIHSCGSFLI